MKYTLSILILLLPALISAQTNYKSGYIVTNSGDTISGLINYKERVSNANTVSMKTGSSVKPKEYGVNEIIAYGITGIESYEQHLVTISQHTIDPANLSIGIDSSYRTDKVFLKVIQKGGKVNLFSYRDNIKPRFYIQDSAPNSCK
ncbi:MAG: hypothetical protein EOO85_34085 [Pedobacter sp.]|nr:MAG: hypothetical protein EOO85_34085 [Pedobacter sp.]